MFFRSDFLSFVLLFFIRFLSEVAPPYAAWQSVLPRRPNKIRPENRARAKCSSHAFPGCLSLFLSFSLAVLFLPPLKSLHPPSRCLFCSIAGTPPLCASMANPPVVVVLIDISKRKKSKNREKTRGKEKTEKAVFFFFFSSYLVVVVVVWSRHTKKHTLNKKKMGGIRKYVVMWVQGCEKSSEGFESPAVDQAAARD